MATGPPCAGPWGGTRMGAIGKIAVVKKIKGSDEDEKKNEKKDKK
jgi:hypothetical protein